MWKGPWRLTDRCVQEEVLARSLSRMNMLIHVTHTHTRARECISFSSQTVVIDARAKFYPFVSIPPCLVTKWLFGSSFTPLKKNISELSMSRRKFVFYWYAFIHSKFISTFSVANVFLWVSSEPILWGRIPHASKGVRWTREGILFVSMSNWAIEIRSTCTCLSCKRGE